MSDESPFLFVVCQAGAEWALKADVARQHPNFRFAYSRPGLVTFKLPPGANPDHQVIESAFARTYGTTLGKVQGEPSPELAAQIAPLCDGLQFKQLHVWQRDSAIPGHQGFEPGVTPEVAALADRFSQSLGGQILSEQIKPNEIARRNQRVLDLMAVEPGEWLVGHHLATRTAGRWPGGVPTLRPPEEPVSRAWLKMQESLLWSRFPINEAEPWIELGSSPGGSCQALLGRGLKVTGVDPAKMDERLLAEERFRHWQKRADDVRLRDLKPFRWLASDLNVAPQTTLDTVERMVSHDSVNLRGLLLTLKLLDRPMYEEVSQYRQRVLDWGFEQVRVRQLAFNRQEFCLAALKRRSSRRESGRRHRRRVHRGQ